MVIVTGLIGLAIEWGTAEARAVGARLDRAGCRAPATTDVAAGMLAPVTETDFGEEGRIA